MAGVVLNMMSRNIWFIVVALVGAWWSVTLMAGVQEGDGSGVSKVLEKEAEKSVARKKAEAHAETMDEPEFGWDPLAIIGSKHDLSALNKRAGAKAMEGVAYDDYGYACVYCHVPPDVDKKGDGPQQIAGWNRIRSDMRDYTLYSSRTFKSTARIPNEITMLCLSCHDGTIAVDQVVNTPRAWKSGEKMTLHMKINSGTDLDHCGLCHDGFTAHHLGNRHLGTDMRRNHPVSIRYPGLGAGASDSLQAAFNSPVDDFGFANGVRLFDGFVECASCHNVHEPSKVKFLRVKPEYLCITCHSY